MITSFIQTGNFSVYFAIPNFISIQIFILGLLFLKNSEKRSRFILRLSCVCATLLLMALFVPLSLETQVLGLIPYGLGVFGSKFAYAVIALYICYKVKFSFVLFVCCISFCAQNVTTNILNVIIPYVTIENVVGDNIVELLLIAACFILVYFSVYKIFIAQTKGALLIRPNTAQTIAFVVTVLFVSIFLSSYLPSHMTDSTSKIVAKGVVSLCDILIICLQIFTLMYSRSTYDIQMVSSMWAKDREAYLLKKEKMDSLNLKIHDVKHLIRNLDYSEISDEINEIDDSIDQYDAVVYTGNKALDVAVNEKLDYCRRHDIEFTVIANGEELYFMKDTDIYSLFGNILENAIESVSKIEEKEKRVISLNISSLNKEIYIKQSNFYLGEVELENGIPQTTKAHKEDHGFGVKSICLLVEKYGGNCAFSFENGIFSLEINLPKEI